jgi:hypothetical protein
MFRTWSKRRRISQQKNFNFITLMRIIITLISLSIHLISIGQKENWTPFTLIVLRPDTAIIDKSFNTQRDSFELYQIKSDLRCRNISIDSLTAIKKSIPSGFKYSSVDLYSLESLKQIIDYKYYYFLSEYSTGICEFLFNNYQKSNGVYAMAHDVKVIEMANQKTDRRSLKLLADSVKADYIVYFKNIRTIRIDSSISLKMSTCVHSTKEDKVIVEKEIESQSFNVRSASDLSSVMWNCNSKLECLLVNAVRISSDLVVNAIRQRQNINK